MNGRIERVELNMRDMVYEIGRPIDFVYFPAGSVVSIVTEMSDRRAVEVATVGSEGMLGLPVFLQAAYASAHRAFAQLPGPALRLPTEAFNAVLQPGSTLFTLLQRYTEALFTQVAVSSACNRLHRIEQRCARWLLMTHDRAGRDEFPLTQEFLAQMLGVQRTTVNVVARQFTDAGLVSYTRGRITILDRPRLETVTCECYGLITDEFERLIP
jgi:CRP-like cAMP-binding protein